ncbi:MAG TPA: hypothetical protein VIS96_02880 [Terrimicrobiaceae bacterium]
MSSPQIALTPTVSSMYRFLKVEEFFDSYESWPAVTAVESYVLDTDRKALRLTLKKQDGAPAVR